MLNKSTIQQWTIQAMAMRSYPDKRFPPSRYYRFLRIAAQNMQPKLSVELGVCGGGGSLHLAMGWAGGRVVGVDIEIEKQYEERIAYIEDKHLNFTLRIGDSVQSAKYITDHYGNVDILFIDTTHTYEQTMAEYNAWLPYMSDNSIICFDDLLRPGMEQVWDELPEPKLRLDHLHDGAENGGGFGVIWNE